MQVEVEVEREVEMEIIILYYYYHIYIIIIIIVVVMMMVTQQITTGHIPTRWESVMMMKGGNMTQSNSHHTHR